VLAFHCAADPAEFRRSIVIEAAVGFDFAAQEAKEWSQIVLEQRGRKLDDTWPLIPCAVGGRIDEVVPCSDALHNREEITNLSGLKSGVVDASLVKKHGGVEESAELKTTAAS
jgi:hypothetical protein